MITFIFQKDRFAKPHELKLYAEDELEEGKTGGKEQKKRQLQQLRQTDALTGGSSNGGKKENWIQEILERQKLED